MSKVVGMQGRTAWSCTLLVFAGLAALPAWAKDFEQAQKEISTAFDKIKSYTANTHTQQDIEVAPGARTKTEMKGTIAMLRKDGKILTRAESKGETIIKTPEGENKTQMNTLLVSDDKLTYSLTDTGEMKYAMKMRTPPQGQADLKKAWDTQAETMNIKVLSDEKVDGQNCTVIEMTPKKEDPQNPVARTVVHYRKDLGINVKIETFDKDKKSLMVSTITNIKTDVALPEERFKFEAPAGVEVMDMTAYDPSAPATASASQPAEDK